MKGTALVITACMAFVASGCAGCGRLDDLQDNARTEGGSGLHDPYDVSTRADGGREAALDASGATSDAGGESDVPATDLGGASDQGVGPTSVCGNDAIEESEVCDDGNTADGDYCAGDCSSETGRCGDATRQPNEGCDDGVTADCAATHDGGEGTCVPEGECSLGYVDTGMGCVPSLISQHVHIYVANDCSMMVDPAELNVPRGQTVQFSWHNHSQYYAVDVWQSYIGGYTDLATGMTWNEQFEWCSNVNPYVGYSDITTNSACPSHRFTITCNGR